MLYYKANGFYFRDNAFARIVYLFLFMAEIAQILEKTVSASYADQELALTALNDASQINFPEFIHQLAVALSDAGNSPIVRRAAGLQIKNALVSREQALSDQKRNRWLSIPAELRDVSKRCVLQSLGTETRPSVAAQCIAAIACIELPSNQWPELLDRLVANVTSDETDNALLREASLEALGYIGLDMAEKQRIGPVLAAIVRGMQREESSVYVRLAATKALSEIVDWVATRTLEEHVDAIVDATCAFLQTAELNLYEEAAKCLWKIASRKCAKTAETPIVVSMFRDGPMRQILTAANLAADVSSSSYEHYKYLKALCDLLCALGLHLADVWSYVMKPPPNFSLYLAALSAFFRHPSIYIRAETAQVLATFYGHERISKNADFLTSIPPLIHFLPKAMSKSCCAASSTAQQDPTEQYSQLDYEGEVECQREYIRLRDHCLRIIRECAQDHFEKLMAVMRDWIANRCVRIPENVPPDEWEVMKRLITAVLQTSFSLDLATPEVRKEYLAYFDAVFHCSVRISSSMHSAKQQRLLNGLLSILSALFPIFNDCPERIPIMLDHLKSLLMIDNSKQDMDIMATKRHSIALLLKIVSFFSQAIKPYGHSLLELVQSVTPFVSMMQRANLVPILAALSNLAYSVDAQATFLSTSIKLDIDFIENEPFSTSPSNFLLHSGLTAMPDPMAVMNQQCPFYQNRLNLKASLTALEGVLGQINVTSEEGETKQMMNMFFGCLNLIYDPRNSSLIHVVYGQSVLEMGSSERLMLVSSLNPDGMEKENGGRKGADEFESSQSSGTNGGISTTDSTIFMRRFIREITDLIQSIVGLVCARFYRDFYAISDVADAIERVYVGIECVPDFRFRFWIKRTWSRIVCSCPTARSDIVLDFLKKTTKHMQKRLVEQWELLKRRQSPDEVYSDTEPTEEEMIAESTMSLLSRECALFVSTFILGDSFSPKNAKKDALVTQIAQVLLMDKEVFLDILGLLAKLITCPDSQAAVKCVPILNVLTINYDNSFEEQTAVQMLIHALQSLQMYVSDELAAGPILTLIFNIYSTFRPRYPALLDVLRQIPNCMPDNIEQFDQRIMGTQSNDESKLHDKIKRDLMRKVLISRKVKVHHGRKGSNGTAEDGEMD
uniref:Golgi SNAP receptor complex member 2 n=1 Tax=Globodera rostochiensis TaxID=31243 RepID=A0A914H404_GLORO